MLLMFNTFLIIYKLIKSRFHWFVNIKVAVPLQFALHSNVIKNPYFLVSYIFKFSEHSSPVQEKKAEKREIQAPLECS